MHTPISREKDTGSSTQEDKEFRQAEDFVGQSPPIQKGDSAFRL